MLHCLRHGQSFCNLTSRPHCPRSLRRPPRFGRRYRWSLTPFETAACVQKAITGFSVGKLSTWRCVFVQKVADRSPEAGGGIRKRIEEAFGWIKAVAGHVSRPQACWLALHFAAANNSGVPAEPRGALKRPFEQHCPKGLTGSLAQDRLVRGAERTGWPLRGGSSPLVTRGNGRGLSEDNFSSSAAFFIRRFGDRPEIARRWTA